ncbi:MAG TPA: hypothetical protein VMO80_04305 [Terriglobales bacterium]|nr:hypothetical protein [Terriglobales bacterium]
MIPNVAVMWAEFVHMTDHDPVMEIVGYFSRTPKVCGLAVHNTPHNSSMSLAVFTVPARALLVLLSR